MIDHRLKHTYYKDLSAFVRDFHLMFHNAMTFNLEGSFVYNDAIEMKKIFDAKMAELAPGGELQILPEDEVGDSGSSVKRSRSVSDSEEEAGYQGLSGGKGKRKSRGTEEERPKAKKVRRSGDIPGLPNKYGTLPKIRLKNRAQEGDPEEGEISE